MGTEDRLYVSVRGRQDSSRDVHATHPSLSHGEARKKGREVDSPEVILGQGAGEKEAEMAPSTPLYIKERLVCWCLAS